MDHHRTLDQLTLSGSVVTIGSFDGVHRGHQALIREVAALAQTAHLPAVAVTFFPHPVVVLRDLKEPYYLTGPDERARLLSEFGIDHVVTMEFNRALASQTAEEFMQNLVTHLGVQQLVVGADFALGRGREGNVDRLSEIGSQFGYKVVVISPVKTDEQIISSSMVRRTLAAGEVEEAGRLLGRPYSVSGKIVSGDRRGHTLGYPTANIETWPQKLLPGYGVYVTWAKLPDGRRLPSATSIGLRPTFQNQDNRPRIETFILDFNEDLYGRELEIDFVKRIRPELKFDSIQELVDQMDQDTRYTREVLQNDA